MAAVVVPAAAAVAGVGAAGGGAGSSGSSEDLSFKSGGHGGGGSAASKVAAFKSLHYHYQGQKSQHKLPRGAALAKQQAQQLHHGRRHHFHRHISADYLSEVDAGRRCNR